VQLTQIKVCKRLYFFYSKIERLVILKVIVFSPKKLSLWLLNLHKLAVINGVNFNRAGWSVYSKKRWSISPFSPVYEKEKYLEEDVKEIENGVNVIHFNIMIGTGFQYNLNRQIGIRTDFNLGYGITNGYGVSAFLLPKISLCYKPDRLK